MYCRPSYNVLLAASITTLTLGIGCGEKKPYGLASVSGVVTLDGKPLSGGGINFQPIGGSTKNPGPSSGAEIDATGHYELVTIRKEPGAVVGKHRVKIYGPSSETPSADIVPARYNSNTELTFDVPADGASNADFSLTSKPK